MAKRVGKIRLNGKMKFFNRFSINFKIIMYYLALLFLSVILSVILYQQVLSGIVSREVGALSIQMLQSVSSNFNSAVSIAGDYSRIIMTNDKVQDALKTASKGHTLFEEVEVYTSVIKLIEGSQFISSVYIFDNYGNSFDIYKDDRIFQGPNDLTQTEWYQEVKQKKGGYIIRLNAGGVMKPIVSKDNYISVIRLINDLQTQKPIGLMIMNLSVTAVVKNLSETFSDYSTELAIYDNNYQSAVTKEGISGFDINSFAINNSGNQEYWMEWNNSGGEYIASYLEMPRYGWKIASVIPLKELSRNEIRTFSLVAFAVIAANGALLFVGSIFISRLITVPIKKLLVSMKGIEQGEFNEVEIKTGNDEIGSLRNGYNKMIKTIKKLIEEIIEEQKMKRKLELDILQAQIKPHFLYNTFDAISSLVISGKNTDAYIIMKALGAYYRTSLSKGREVITVSEEMNVVLNYLKIQKYRYDDMFTYNLEMDEKISECKILKLVLQPFVENAIYHGIKPKESSGKINIRAIKAEEFVRLTIEDDGVGMTKEITDSIVSSKVDNDSLGFGICGTIERLRIFYGMEDVVTIESSEGSGTKISLKVPVK